MSDTPSPLAEANPESLQEIFDKDTLNLTDDDVERIIAEERAARERWMKAESAGKHKRVTKQTVANIDLADLGL